MIIKNPLIEAFIAIHDSNSVHSASRALGLTQTAVTQRLKLLEKDLKLTLFLRSRRGMALTADGESLLAYCGELAILDGLFLSKIDRKNNTEARLTLVGPTSAISTRVADNCLSVYAQFPHLKLNLQSRDQADLILALKKGEADLAIVSPDDVPNEMMSKRLKPDRYILVCSPKWKHRKLSEILETERLIDFAENDKTSLRYLKMFGRASKIKRDRIFVNENEALIRLLTNGVGFGTLTESVAAPFIARHQLHVLNQGRAMEEPLALVWYPRSHTPDYFAALVKSIR